MFSKPVPFGAEYSDSDFTPPVPTRESSEKVGCEMCDRFEHRQ